MTATTAKPVAPYTTVFIRTADRELLRRLTAQTRLRQCDVIGDAFRALEAKLASASVPSPVPVTPSPAPAPA